MNNLYTLSGWMHLMTQYKKWSNLEKFINKSQLSRYSGWPYLTLSKTNESRLNPSFSNCSYSSAAGSDGVRSCNNIQIYYSYSSAWCTIITSLQWIANVRLNGFSTTCVTATLNGFSTRCTRLNGFSKMKFNCRIKRLLSNTYNCKIKPNFQDSLNNTFKVLLISNYNLINWSQIL